MLSEEELKELIEMDSEIKRAEKKLEYLSSNKEAIELYRVGCKTPSETYSKPINVNNNNIKYL